MVKYSNQGFQNQTGETNFRGKTFHFLNEHETDHQNSASPFIYNCGFSFWASIHRRSTSTIASANSGTSFIRKISVLCLIPSFANCCAAPLAGLCT
ncbi:hypothetical protein ES288_D02G157700v1 [Gossypium darwinii]|uniref:Uncharacterized protein n=1 Tax=Gossypium darwinii TaxID=34276 RepID=A0A5D2DHC1_GOSDA|nr:hypothetical protein ES288_D02G157700v1 [Gossypium darwinii]